MLYMIPYTALTYPVLQLRLHSPKDGWKAFWASTENAISPFSGREDIELLTWYLTGYCFGVTKSWKKAIDHNTRHGFPLNLSPSLVKALKKKRPNTLEQDHKSVGYLGSLPVKELQQSLTGKIYKALPQSAKRDLTTTLALAPEAGKPLWNPLHPWTINTRQTAHQQLEMESIKQTLEPGTLTLDIFAFPEYQLYTKTD